MAKKREHEKTVESDSDSTDNESQESEPKQTKTTPAAAATKKPKQHKKSASKPLIPPTKTRRSPSPNRKKTGSTKKPVESDSDSTDNDSQEPEPEPEQTKTAPASAATKRPILDKKSASKPQTSSESDGSSGSESDEPESPKDHPPQKTTGARKSISAAADPVTPAAPKRPAEEKESKVSKKKKAAEPEPSEKKKSISQRKWSESDEIVILQGMVDYWDQKQADPNAHVNEFLDFIKENLNRKDSLKSHLQDKIRKLRIKYENNSIKEEKTGKEMSFSKPHEQTVFELSKRVWGRIKKKKNRTVEEGKASEPVDAPFLARRVKSNFGDSFEERILSFGAEIFESGKGDAAAAGVKREEWEKLRKEELQANLRLLEVKAAQARLVIEHLK